MVLLSHLFLWVWFTCVLLIQGNEDCNDEFEEEGKIASLCMETAHLENVWTPYKDERCLLFKKNLFLDYKEAKEFCRSEHSANLVTVEEADKQVFLEEFLEKNNVLNQVWIGLERTKRGNYKWTSGDAYTFKNWAEGSPRNISSCFELHANHIDLERSYGKWNISCEKKNVVVCEKVQPWSLMRLQTLIVHQRKNPVPIGFTYVQLPGAKPPTELWPSVAWQEISQNYQGVFFRVVGGQASAFGEVQPASLPRLIKVQNKWLGKWTDGQGIVEGEITLPEFGWSDGAFSVGLFLNRSLLNLAGGHSVPLDSFENN